MENTEKNENNLQIFLDNFVKTFQSDEDLVEMETTKIVIDSIDNNLKLSEFVELINNNNLKNKPTGLFLCDFNKNEDISIINIIENYEGLYNLYLNYNLDKEGNEIYAVFSNPTNCYKCFLDLQDNININNQKYDLEDISYIL